MIQTKPTAAHRIPGVLNVGIIAAQLTALAACFWAAAHTHHWGLILALAIAFGILMNSVYSIIHEAEHAMLFPNRSANEIAGVLMALFFLPHVSHRLRCTKPSCHLVIPLGHCLCSSRYPDRCLQFLPIQMFS